jgi:hypothetical protein
MLSFKEFLMERKSEYIKELSDLEKQTVKLVKRIADIKTSIAIIDLQLYEYEHNSVNFGDILL